MTRRGAGRALLLLGAALPLLAWGATRVAGEEVTLLLRVNDAAEREEPRRPRDPRDDVAEVYGRPALRELLLGEGWLPAAHGALFRVIPVHQRNAMYDTEMTFFTLTDLLGLKSRRVGGLLNDARYTDLEYNLLWFQRRYEGLLARAGRRGADEPEGDDEYERFRAAYFAWAGRQLEDVKAKLAQLYAGR